MWTSLPNLLTMSRIGVIPVFCLAFWLPQPWDSWVPLALFAGAGITDWADGYAARRWGLVSDVGRFLDPVADKLLVAAAILMLVAVDRIEGVTVLAAVVILCREIMVTGLREFLAEVRVKVPVSRMAKWKTMVQLLALGFLIGGKAAPPAIYGHEVGVAGLWVAALLTLYTGYDYLTVGLRHMDAPERSAESLRG
jgi:cardiolipin synthase